MWAESLGSLKSCLMSTQRTSCPVTRANPRRSAASRCQMSRARCCGRGEVHGSSCPLAASWLVEFLTDVRQAFGRRRTVGMRGWFGAERRGAGFRALGGTFSLGWISVHQDISMCVTAESRIGVTAA
jgi:hypothetical protein